MIQKLSFTNYKAFEQGEIKIKPITILLGANSVGKSSILQLLLMLQQTSLSNNYKSSLKLNGENISMGENENIFKDKKSNKNISIEFEFSDNKLMRLLKTELVNDLVTSLIRPLSYIDHFNQKSGNKKTESVIYKFIERTNHEIKREVFESKSNFIDLINTIDDYTKSISEKSKKDSLFDDFRYITREYFNETKIDEKSATNIYDFLLGLKEIKNDFFTLKIEIQNIKAEKDDVLKVLGISLNQAHKTILDIKFEINSSKNGYENIIISSDFVENLADEKVVSELMRILNYDSTLFSIVPSYNNRRVDFLGFRDEEYSMSSDIIIQIISRAMDNVRSVFSKQLINYVSPLRAHPKRYYFLDKANINTSLNTLDGDSLTEILKENRKVKESVNKWLKNFNLSVNVSTLQDVIHKLKVKQNNLDLDITDVGFGISQVLPVIVQGFLSFSNSLTIIEQPEIHLHPKMQADLADLFIDIVSVNKKSQKKYLLIETHSEYLLKRLRRRIAEGKIKSEDVAIYFVHPKDINDNSGRIEEKIISPTGAFDWPKDFYADDLLLDTIEFIKIQNY